MPLLPGSPRFPEYHLLPPTGSRLSKSARLSARCLVVILSLYASHLQHASGAKPRSSSTDAKNPKVRELLKAASDAAESHDFEGALKTLQSLLPIAQDEAYEEALYRIALCHFQMGNFQKSGDGLDAFIQKFPNSPFLPEAEFKLASARFPQGHFGVVVQLCQSWEARHEGHPLLGEVAALRGDALVSIEKREEAAGAYRLSAEQSLKPGVAAYALGEACKQWQKLGRWDACKELVISFLEKRPGHLAELPAQDWLAEALSQLGHPTEARQTLATSIQKHLGERDLETVEPALKHLARLCIPAPDSKKNPPPASDSSLYHAELMKRLDPGSAASALAKARLAYAEIELFRLLKKTGEADRRLNEMLSDASPSQLSAPLLALAGDRLLAKAEIEKASLFYSELSRAFPNSAHRLSALNGLGQIALNEKNAPEALRFFEEALGGFASDPEVKLSALGKGHALLALQRFDEARAAFEKVASNRSWRGEATAEAVYMIGETLLQKGEPRSAVQYFQRVFVAYQHYVPIVAKAYLRAADCFERLDSPEKAQAHLRELLRKKKFSDAPETEIARQRLERAKEEAPAKKN